MTNSQHSRKKRFFATVLSLAFSVTTTLSVHAEQLVFIAASTGADLSTTAGPVIPWDQVDHPEHPMLMDNSYEAVTLGSAYVLAGSSAPVMPASHTQPIVASAPTVPIMPNPAPAPTPNRNHVSQNAHNVQMLPWSYVRTFLTPYEHIVVHDVLTGLSYTMYSFSNGSHADVRTVSQADTNVLFHTFGYQWGWNVRPVWVTIGNRTIAASINGQPHGGNGNPANGMGGHVCLHFFGSNVHNGNAQFARLHQDVVHNAYAIANREN